MFAILFSATATLIILAIEEVFCNQLVYKFNKPLVSTSANVSGKPTPKNFSEIANEIKNGVEYAVNPTFDNGNHQPSSIIKIGLRGEIEVIHN